jgi:peptidoglycan/xylan/chitin deacetylase (PgdA/CDA1 family)
MFVRKRPLVKALLIFPLMALPMVGWAKNTAPAGQAASVCAGSVTDSGVLLTQATSLIAEVDQQWQDLFSTWMTEMGAYLQASSWPEIHPQARQAKVPVIMYHDVLPRKYVSWDVTPQELEEHFELIKRNGLTPISLAQLMTHLQTGLPLPEKPIVLTFDDGYEGHYTYVFDLMKRYNYPAVFSIYTKGVGVNTGDASAIEQQRGRPHLSWEHLKEMVANPLVEIASHSVTHPLDLRKMTDEQVRRELKDSKETLESKLGISIEYFVYPVGKNDERIRRLVREAGYKGALVMHEDAAEEQLAGESDNLLAIGRWGQSRFREAITKAWGGPPLPKASRSGSFNFNEPIQLKRQTIDRIPLIMASGGRPVTIHAKSRYQVQEILDNYINRKAIVGVAGGFFSLEFLDSNQMIGPVLGQNSGKFIPGRKDDNVFLTNRPLVLIGPRSVKFVPFNHEKHNTLEGIRAEMPDVTDAFVAAAWLVRNGQPQPAEAFGRLFDYNAERHRTFWGISKDGQPNVGVTTEMVDSVRLGKILERAGLQDAVMLDSGASTSLAYRGESLVGYTPRPVPHVVALAPPEAVADCKVANNQSVR